jgi:hypothetical protein
VLVHACNPSTFKANLGYIVNLRPVWTTYRPCLKEQKPNKKEHASVISWGKLR